MRYDIERLRGMAVQARDGEIGTIDDVYFEDDSWIVRYLVVDTGGWLTGRKVLLSPHAVERVDAAAGRVLVNLTQQQVKDSPDFDAQKPVSRQFETSLYAHYGYPYYWRGPYLWGVTPYPATMAIDSPQGTPTREVEEMAARERAEEDPHLRSAGEVTGYYVEARDGDIGHVESFLVDERTWRIVSLVIDTKNWWPGKHVVVQPSAIERIDWPEHKVYVSALRETVKSSPEYRMTETGAA